MNRIITVSREFGSGGRELGKRLADALGFSYYDKEIIHAIREKTDLNEDYIENSLESDLTRQIYPVNFSRTFYFSPTMIENTGFLLSQQHQVIKEIAQQGDCVIVGRGADTILEEYKPLKIFVYASMSSKVQRTMARAPEGESLTQKEYEKKIRQVDKARAHNYNLFSDKDWGDKYNYHLCVNTSFLEIECMVPSVKEFALQWFDAQCNVK